MFPKGMSGAPLNILARQHLWKAGLDFGREFPEILERDEVSRRADISVVSLLLSLADGVGRTWIYVL